MVQARLCKWSQMLSSSRNFLGRLEARAGLLRLHLGDNVTQPIWNLRIDLANRRRVSSIPASYGHRSDARTTAGRAHCVEHAAEAKQVGAMIDRFAGGLLRAMNIGVAGR